MSCSTYNHKKKKERKKVAEAKQMVAQVDKTYSSVELT